MSFSFLFNPDLMPREYYVFSALKDALRNIRFISDDKWQRWRFEFGSSRYAGLCLINYITVVFMCSQVPALKDVLPLLRDSLSVCLSLSVCERARAHVCVFFSEAKVDIWLSHSWLLRNGYQEIKSTYLHNMDWTTGTERHFLIHIYK